MIELGGDGPQQPRPPELPERLPGVARPQNLEVLLEQPRRGAACDFVLVGVDGLEDGRVDGELEPRREDHRAEHADRILEETHVRVADAADQP
jgi:hypothetical protein